MKTIYLVLFYVLSVLIVKGQPKNLYTTDVKSILQEINLARINPKLYGINNNLESERLDTLLSKEPFILNYNLCQKAYSYSVQLSKVKYNENYVISSHSNMGYNESLAFNDSIYKVCKQLILDEGTSSKGHRFHLLSVNNKDTKIGIGISYIKQLNWYIVVIVTE